MTAEVPSRRRARGFEPWMISNVAIGMAIGSFLTLLVPPFITDVTGSAARVGIVFALISLAATVGPGSAAAPTAPDGTAATTRSR